MKNGHWVTERRDIDKKEKKDNEIQHHTKTHTRRNRTTYISVIAHSSFEDKNHRSEYVKMDQKQKTNKEPSNAHSERN